ncbi:U32 family peptidase [Gemmatimonas sp.]|jgi:putative protease|uniref:U32 family peptidase n=1 Tax=Gemmatimonas sp. TaxID=1962908 RepID=UPI0025C30474|nr:U32 family peptidase [Gemmatimonas sp.]MCA2982358.1 U32 family peptidase [Gemmatimonas sp.]MCA2987424.1 U32 family peptidase [Gemmatimonas sp.]MCA2996835.1 U32 family peptidase [Gemmatimonas sp.]MCE2952366.1 U32 family peptidase [Gemmatimonas sp.]
MARFPVPELLAPAGTIDAVRAAVANGANAVYLGASMYNARDEGAQLTLDELGQACAIAHARGVRVYLTFNVLIKPHELSEALQYLGECIDRGIDAAIVQDLGVVRLIQQVYPQLEVHGSTQMTVHDVSGARVMQQLGVERVVLARENTLEDIRAIREQVPALSLETFVHGALCISYSGQCFMSGMISERSANRGSCAQSCRKDYTLTDEASGATLDRGYLISTKDLAAHDHLEAIARLGVGCLKVEGRKKKPEYVATVTKAYRGWLDGIARGESGRAPDPAEVEPLVQIFSRGNTGGMYGGRQGREYITRTQPDNRGLPIGLVTGADGAALVIEVQRPVAVGDGLGFEAPAGDSGASLGGTVAEMRTLSVRAGVHRQAVLVKSGPRVTRVPEGWHVVRTTDANLMDTARQSFAQVAVPERTGVQRLDVRCFGQSGSPLKTVWRCGDIEVTVRGDVPLAQASKRSLDMTQLREQFGRLGGTPFKLGAVDISGLASGLFLPVSELNRVRQDATEQIEQQRGWARMSEEAVRSARIAECVTRVPEATVVARVPLPDRFALRAVVFDVEQAREAAGGGATEIVLDPFLRHPAPPLARVAALRDELAGQGVALRLRTPSIVRPEERARLTKWFGLGLPLLTGHLGLAAEFGAAGHDVVADYAVNVFNQHTAALLFECGVPRLVASIELTTDELGQLVAPWGGHGFDVLVYGRPEGMTIEHCVLSAAFDREPTTCRDLCVQKHTNVSLTDPAGYTFAVATDSNCRNRLLHSRPIEASEFLPALWGHGIRGFHMVFNVPGDPVRDLVRAHRSALDALDAGEQPDVHASRRLLNNVFTRGHFARAV